MAEMFNKELAAKVKNVQENLKADVCKCCEEKACNGCFVGDMTEAYTLRTEIVLEQEKLDFINQLLSMTGDEIYDKYGLKRDETIVYTAVFPDGMQADIKLVICDEEPYTEAVLFDKNGFQKAYTDPEDEYTGDWELEYDDVNYVVTVKVKEPVGYRLDGILGDGYRNAVDVMTHIKRFYLLIINNDEFFFTADIFLILKFIINSVFYEIPLIQFEFKFCRIRIFLGNDIFDNRFGLIVVFIINAFAIKS